jgi:hypothetical protein
LHQGKRTDLQLATDTLLEEGVHAVAMEFPSAFVKYHRGLKELQLQKNQKTRMLEIRNVVVIVFYGKPGTGKTHYAHYLPMLFGQSSYSLAKPSSKGQSLWFDGYDDQEVCIQTIKKERK